MGSRPQIKGQWQGWTPLPAWPCGRAMTLQRPGPGPPSTPRLVLMPQTLPSLHYIHTLNLAPEEGSTLPRHTGSAPSGHHLLAWSQLFHGFATVFLQGSFNFPLSPSRLPLHFCSRAFLSEKHSTQRAFCHNSDHQYIHGAPQLAGTVLAFLVSYPLYPQHNPLRWVNSYPCLSERKLLQDHKAKEVVELGSNQAQSGPGVL